MMFVNHNAISFNTMLIIVLVNNNNGYYNNTGSIIPMTHVMLLYCESKCLDVDLVWHKGIADGLHFVLNCLL